MKTLFTGLLGAGLVFGTPTQAKFIGTTFYMPNVMLGMCKSEIARGEAGFCTGYVIATEEQLAGAGQVCLPPGVEYEDMLRAVVNRIETVGRRGIPVFIPNLLCALHGHARNDAATTRGNGM